MTREDPKDKYRRLREVLESVAVVFRETDWPDDKRIRNRQISIEVRVEELLTLLALSECRLEDRRRKRMKFNES